MKYLLATLLALVAGAALAGTVIPVGASVTTLTVAWSPPTSNVDGSPITGAITYNAYFSFGSVCSAAPLTALMNASPIASTSYLVTGVGAGLKCFAVTAVVNGVESAQSAQVAVTVTQGVAPPVIKTPSAPTGVTVQ